MERIIILLNIIRKIVFGVLYFPLLILTYVIKMAIILISVFPVIFTIAMALIAITEQLQKGDLGIDIIGSIILSLVFGFGFMSLFCYFFAAAIKFIYAMVLVVTSFFATLGGYIMPESAFYVEE